MKKPYTWEEIKEILVKELKKTKHIMTSGTLGSCNVERDIDLIIAKKPKSSSSNFYKEVHGLLDNLNNYVSKKYNSHAIRFSGYEPEFLTLSNYNEKDLAIQTFIYVSYTQIKKDWKRSLFPDEDIKKILAKNYNCLMGSVNDLFSKGFQKEHYCDSIFVYLMMYDRINANYSEKFLVKVMNFYFEYLFKKRLGLKVPVAKNKKDVRRIFYELCDILDELNSKKSK